MRERCWAAGWVGGSPVDLQLEADLGSRIFEPLDRKPQTDRQLGEEAKEREREDG